MIWFKSSKDNDEYLMVDGRYTMMLLGQNQNLTDDEIEEADKIYFGLYEFEKLNNNTHVSEIAIRKDSAIGQYLLNNSDSEIINEDLYIFQEDVKNALLISLYEHDTIYEKIIDLFRAQVGGYKAVLLEQYDESVLDYILTHRDFESWINKEEIKPKEYVVFENGEFSRRVLSTGKKVLEKKDENKSE